MTTPPVPLCEACALHGSKPNGMGHACRAFPAGIPDAIYIEGFDHRRPYPGDDGIVFRLKKGEERTLAAYEASA